MATAREEKCRFPKGEGGGWDMVLLLLPLYHVNPSLPPTLYSTSTPHSLPFIFGVANLTRREAGPLVSLISALQHNVGTWYLHNSKNIKVRGIELEH